MDGISNEELLAGKRLLQKIKKGVVLFSEGTYQVEIPDGKTVYWPFLQISSTGEILDAFCTCKIGEKKGFCPHLAAAYLKITKGGEPLHVRFKESLWNKIALICADRHGYDPSCLKEKKNQFEAYGPTGKRYFLLRPLKAKAEKQLHQLLYKRPIETEETSLKFSNLSPEELNLWRIGRPSPQLQYELSFWSDLAKWWMSMQEEGVKYSIDFSAEEPPHYLTAHFPDLNIDFYIEPGDWQEIIPALQTVDSPLKVHPYLLGKLLKIVFLEDSGEFAIEFEEEGKMPTIPEGKESALIVGDWYYFPEQGFFPREMDPLLLKKRIPKQEVDLFFQRHLKLIQKNLTNEKIHPHPVPVQYAIQFGEKQNLEIQAYIFEKGDLSQRHAHYFGKWAYLPNHGFFQLENQLFDGPHLHIPKDRVADFVNRHRVWFNSYEGFQTHVSGVESYLGYRFNQRGNLTFHTRFEISEEKENIFDFGEWLYVRGKGFYAKIATRPGAHVREGMEIPPQEISNFIHLYHDELEPIPNFFASQCPLEKVGLNIRLNEEERIQISPEYFYHKGYTANKVKIYGDYTYVENEGFALIPHVLRLPQSYRNPKIIDKVVEPYFVGYELELLYPHVLHIDPRLKRPESMKLHLLNLKRDEESKTGQWIATLQYETEFGTITPYEIWDSLSRNRPYLFSRAGLIFLRDRRFDWLKGTNKKRWMQQGSSVRFTTLDLVRLTALEEIVEPKGEGKKATEARTLFRDFLSLKPPSEIDTTGLKSSLRLYQKTGVAWLWFLYSYGLSGLLCDEMGLGKTHQAMGLIAGVRNKKKGAKFLVVCPTSVIYHWEVLLNTFLPDAKVYIFHGIERRLEDFTEDHYDILLTSYGIIRTENVPLSKFHFDVAIYDELQFAKNQKSMTYKALNQIQAGMRLGLSGTPIENRLLELKALFDLVLPTYLPPVAVFRDLFINPIEKYHDDKKRYLLSRLIRPFLLRRKKSEVLTELPEKIEEVALCDLSEEQRKIYHGLVAANQKALLAQLKDTRKPPPIGHIFSLLSKLKQVCDHPSLILGDKENYKKHSSGKWDLFLELLEETRDSGQKLVIFSQYLDMLDIISYYLKEHNIGYAQIRGSTTDRKEQVKRFAEDPSCEIFLGSLQAAGVGIDLIAASVVIHYDRWWNPARENQATDRVHRMGQKRGVQVFKCVTKNTIEEQIHILIERKLNLVRGILGFDDQDQIKGLERDELILLISSLSNV